MQVSMKTAAPITTKQKEKPYNKKMGAINVVTFGSLFIAWLVIQLHK